MDSTWIGNDNASFDEVDPNNTGITESKGVFFYAREHATEQLRKFFLHSDHARRHGLCDDLL